MKMLFFAPTGLVVGLALAATAPEATAQVTVDRVEYKGWKHNARIANGQAELIVTLDVGPRIISYRLLNGTNVLKQNPDDLGKSGEPDFKLRGGHRLWTAPEVPGRTYAPDNQAVTLSEGADGSVKFTAPPNEQYGLQKEIDVKLDPEGTGVAVLHKIKNVGDKPTEVAPWSLTVMDPGGVEIIPLPPKNPHPGASRKATAEDFAPNHALVAWTYTDFTDPRFTFGSKYILLRQKPDMAATKIGLANRIPWVGYLNHDTLFVKKFPYLPGKTYPDRGCNFETYTDSGILEIETLGPLVDLQPGRTTEHTEHWELHAVAGQVDDEKAVDRIK